MYRQGHVGASMLAYTPTLGLYLFSRGHPLLAVGGFVVAVSTAMLPDIDIRLPGVPHRGPTHTPLFVALASLMAFFSLLVVGASTITGVALAASMAISLISHLFADAITPMGIPHPAWPFKSGRVNLPPGVLASNPIANLTLGLVGVVAAGSVFVVNIETIVRAIVQALGVPSIGLNGPQSPEEWRLFAATAIEAVREVVVSTLRFDHIGVVVIGVMIIFGVVILSKN